MRWGDGAGGVRHAPWQEVAVDRLYRGGLTLSRRRCVPWWEPCPPTVARLRAYRRAPSRTSTFRPEHIQQTGGRPRSVPSTGRVDREQGQAHLPAEQPPPGTHARLPAADAHPGRARHPRRSPPQGPRAAIGLTRPRRCCRPAPGSPVGTSSPRPSAGVDASAALDWSSTSWCLPPSPDPADAPPRAGLVVSRAVGGSVVRHRVARRLRHLLRPRLATPAPGLPAGGAGAAAGCGRTVVRPGRRPRLRSAGGPAQDRRTVVSERGDSDGPCPHVLGGAAARRAGARLPALDLARPAADVPLLPDLQRLRRRGPAGPRPVQGHGADGVAAAALRAVAPWRRGRGPAGAHPPYDLLRTGRVPPPGPARPRTTRSKRRAELHLLPGVGHHVVLAQGLRVRVRRGQRHRVGVVGRLPRVHPPRAALQAVRASGAFHAQDAGVRAGGAEAQGEVRQRPAEARRRDAEAAEPAGRQPARRLPAGAGAGSGVHRPVPRAARVQAGQDRELHLRPLRGRVVQRGQPVRGQARRLGDDGRRRSSRPWAPRSRAC